MIYATGLLMFVHLIGTMAGISILLLLITVATIICIIVTTMVVTPIIFRDDVAGIYVSGAVPAPQADPRPAPGCARLAHTLRSQVFI